jgi:hypothetical protein
LVGVCVKTQSHTNTHTAIAQRQENEMSTEQQIKSAIDSLNEAMQALRELGLMTEEEEDD